ncbi:hypothetical protein BC826DRAFT_920171, partial [Russula brevipes]
DRSIIMLIMLSQIPHAFQQIVSQEKTLTLLHVLPAFEAMTKKWEESSVQYFEAEKAIEEGLMKLASYQNHTDLTPAYCLTMLINPTIKLDWY